MPPATATDKAAIVEAIVASLEARTLRSPALSTVLPMISASIAPRIELTATAPAPLKAMPWPPAEMPTAAEAATETALMLMRSIETS